MHDADLLSCPRQRDVQVIQSARRLGQQPGRVRDQHAVELQPLGLLHREYHDRASEVRIGADGRGWQRRADSRAQFAGEGGRHDHRELAVTGLLCQPDRGLSDCGSKLVRGGQQMPGLVAGLADGPRRLHLPDR